MKVCNDIERNELIERGLALLPTMSVAKACKKISVPQATFRGWMNSEPDLVARYARARTEYMESIAAEIMDISDEPIATDDNGRTDTGKVQQNRLRVDSRKWLLSKLAPKQYGDRLTVAGDEDNPIVFTAIERKVIDSQEEIE